MKSLPPPPPPPPPPPGSALDVLPIPLGPSADEELEELDAADPEELPEPEPLAPEEPAGALPVVVVLPSRVVAAVKAEDRFVAEALALDATEPEEAEELVDVELPAVEEESRP